MTCPDLHMRLLPALQPQNNLPDLPLAMPLKMLWQPEYSSIVRVSIPCQAPVRKKALYFIIHLFFRAQCL